ncbi:MAG: cytochrome c4 [Gammaproteobacteria bacterium]|nr:cytochrome c4 [Gammaproteobacteria bacterium]
MKIAGLLTAVSLLLLSPFAHGAGDPVAGKTKATKCFACHGTNGVSVNPDWPNLAGQVSGYIAKQLTDFKSGARSNPIMAGMVADLSPEDMADIDAYFSAQTAQAGVCSDKELVAAGEQLYRGGNAKTGVSACMSCHGPTGAGIPPRFPRIAGQHAAYAEKQLMEFKRGLRHNDSEVMTRIAFRMSEPEIQAVAHFISCLK